MLINVVRSIRAVDDSISIAVSEEVPEWIREEFGLKAVPTLLNCWGRWASIAEKFHAPRFIESWGRSIFFTATTALLSLCLVLPREVRRRLPGMEGEWVRAIRSTRVIWCNGGGYLTDEGSTEARAALLTAMLGHWCGARIVMTGQGIGPFRYHITRLLMRFVANASAQLVLREATAGGAELRGLGVSEKRFKIGVDDASSLPCLGSSDEVGGVALHYRRSTFHSGTRETEREYLEFIRRVLAAGRTVRLFVFHERHVAEREVYDEWIRVLGAPPGVEVVQEVDPRRLRSRLAQCEAAIGMAYHFNLFALLEGVPSLAVYRGEYYRNKFSGVAESFGEFAAQLEVGAASQGALSNWLESTKKMDRSILAGIAVGVIARGERQLRAAICAAGIERNPNS